MTPTKIRPRALVRASGGPRYAVALAVDALGTGLLRPFLLLYGVTVLQLSATVTGVAMTAGVVLGLACMPAVGRWLDRGARSSVVAASMLVRVAGVALLLTAPAGPVQLAPAGHDRVAPAGHVWLAPAGPVWLFAAAALFLGIGNQAWPAAHAALVATLAHGRERDAALAAGRALRNAGLGAGALLATACLTGGPTALRALAAVTGLAYLVAALLAWSVRLHAHPTAAPAAAPPTNSPAAPTLAPSAGAPAPSPALPVAGPPAVPAAIPSAAVPAASPGEDSPGGPAPRMRALLAANVIYVFCLNIPEVALPLVLVTQVHASPVWPAVIFVVNTVLVVTLQVPVTVLMSRFPRRAVLALSGVVLAASYLGFLVATSLGHGWGAPAVTAVSMICTLGEIVYAGSATALVTALAPPHLLGRALARFQLSTGFGLAVSPAVITALASHGPVTLWGGLSAATLLSASAVTLEKDDGTRLRDTARSAHDGDGDGR